MGFHSGLAANVVKTALDKVFMHEYELPGRPNQASVLDGKIFRQSSTDKSAVITEVMKGPGLWQSRGELQNVYQDNALVSDQQTFNVVNFANSVHLSKNLFDDDQHDTVAQMLREFGMTARQTREKEGMGLYRNGFGTTLTNDGVALFSNSHTNLNGDTVDNLETGVLSESNLNTAIIALSEQVNQAGVISGYSPSCLLVPPALFKTACEITDSELRSGTANNDLNVYSSKYGIMVKQSEWLGAAAGDNGSDTAWFLLSDYHNATRWERQGIQTDLVDYKFSLSNQYVYKGEYREVYGVGTYEGMIGSDGSV